MSEQPTILIVEDEKPLMTAIQTKLNTEGFRTLEAGSINAAKQYLQTESVDVVWLDHYLPSELGIDLVHFMKESDADYSHIPIFLVSNTASADKVYNYLQLGIKQYFVKAEKRLDEIIQAIQDHLSSQS